MRFTDARSWLLAAAAACLLACTGPGLEPPGDRASPGSGSASAGTGGPGRSDGGAPGVSPPPGPNDDDTPERMDAGFFDAGDAGDAGDDGGDPDLDAGGP